MLERKSFSDSQSSEVFDDINCLTRKPNILVLSYSTLSDCPWLSLGWSGGAMVLGKFPVPGRPTNLV